MGDKSGGSEGRVIWERKYDAVIVLGAQVGVDKDGVMALAPHTEIRVRAAGSTFYRAYLNPIRYFILSGGYNVGVRYDLFLAVPVFGTPKSDKKPDFSIEALKKARIHRSEASLMAEYLRFYYQVYPEALILEEDSKTTAENALYCKEILGRLQPQRIFVLTQLYHMERALQEFQKVGLEVETLFAEDVLATEDASWIDRICEYYSVPKGGKQWDVEKIRELLTDRKSIGELIKG